MSVSILRKKCVLHCVTPLHVELNMRLVEHSTALNSSYSIRTVPVVMLPDDGRLDEGGYDQQDEEDAEQLAGSWFLGHFVGEKLG